MQAAARQLSHAKTRGEQRFCHTAPPLKAVSFWRERTQLRSTVRYALKIEAKSVDSALRRHSRPILLPVASNPPAIRQRTKLQSYEVTNEWTKPQPPPQPLSLLLSLIFLLLPLLFLLPLLSSSHSFQFHLQIAVPPVPKSHPTTKQLPWPTPNSSLLLASTPNPPTASSSMELRGFV